jgi:hypothetical protein
VLTSAEEHWGDREVDLVDQPAVRYWRIVATPPPSRMSLP